MNILVTGATGFVGKAVLAQLAADPCGRLRAAVRRPTPTMPTGVQSAVVGDLASDTDWSQAVAGVDVVVHAAARVHVMRETAADPLAEFRRANVDGTLALARQAADAGVRRLVFVSSVKVNGEETSPGKPFTGMDAPQPVDPYGVSKLEAELGLQQLGAASGMEIVVVRPALVYGPAVRGNFLTLLQWVQRGLPLPLGGIRNQRSFIALDNLVSLILLCAAHPSAAGRIFLAADGEDLSTPELILRLGRAMNKRVRLFSIPTGALHGMASLLGRSSTSQRLCGWLQVDNSHARELLNWSTVVSVDDALANTARHFVRTAHR